MADVYSPVGNPPPSYKPNGYPVTVSQAPSQEVPITVDLNSPPVDLSAPIDGRDIALVEQTFARVAMLQPENVGKVIFMKFFKIQPAALELFSFKGGGEDAATLFKLGSPASKHATMVVKTVAIAISLLRDLGTLVPVLQAVGTKHYELSKCKCNAEQYGFGLIPDHYGDFGAAVIEALTVALGPNFTEPVKNAWVKIYTTIVNVWTGSAESGGTIQVADYINYSGYTVRLDAPPVDVSAPIDERDIQLVEQSFAKVACLGADTVGKVIFSKFLAKQPSAAQNFPFDFVDWVADRKATAHVTLLVKTVAVALSLLRDHGTLVPVLQAIGTTPHELAKCTKDADQHGFGLIPDHYGDFGGAVIESLAIALGPDFTEPVKNAWLKIYTTIVSVWTGAAKTGGTIRCDKYWNTAYTVSLDAPAVVVADPIDERVIQLVEQTFAKAAALGPDTVGKVIFTKFFAKAPEALQTFSFKDEPLDWAADRKATAHVTGVVATVATAVGLLRDLPTLVPVLQGIGVKHHELSIAKKNGETYGFGVIPAHYGTLGEAIVESLAIALGPDFTEPVKNAWLKIYTTIVTVWEGAIPKK
jgi:hemoglobin-like flavoprotein